MDQRAVCCSDLYTMLPINCPSGKLVTPYLTQLPLIPDHAANRS